MGFEVITSKSVTITTTGSAGSATGSGTIDELYGFLLDIYLNFHASAPATTDTTVAYGTPSYGNILVVSNSATDALIMPRKEMVTPANASTGLYDYFPLNGSLTISLAGSDALTGAVVATVRYLTL